MQKKIDIDAHESSLPAPPLPLPPPPLPPSCRINECSLTEMHFYRKKKWAKLPSPAKREGFAMAAVDDIVYIVGGKYPHGQLCETLHGSQWTKQADMPDGMEEPILATMIAKLWVVFNTAKKNIGSEAAREITLQCFDSICNWEFKAHLPSDIQSTRGTSIVGHGDRLFLVGGSERIAIYDSTIETWSVHHCPPSYPHHSGYVVSDQVRITLLGGLDGMDWDSGIQQYYSEREVTVKDRNMDTVTKERKWKKSELPSLPVELKYKQTLFITMKNVTPHHVFYSASAGKRDVVPSVDTLLDELDITDETRGSSETQRSKQL